MLGLVPGIHVLAKGKKDVDGRVKPGHDDPYEDRNADFDPRIMISTAAINSSAIAQ